MPDLEELIQALTELDPATLQNVINSAFERRRDLADRAELARPDLGTTPSQFAKWLALRHMETDAAIERVVYLPAGAPAGEIRLLEVNRFLHPPEDDLIEPLDFTPESFNLPFTVLVADVTRDQWERIQRDVGLLPKGWDLKDSQTFTRS
ncbi:MAG: hypothetical protein ACLP7Q_13160 [Isosphaeraceae bacterium]